MKELIPVLHHCALFEGIRREDLPGMLGCMGARRLDIKKGQILFREGDPSTYIGIVISGGIHLLREDYFGNRSIVAHIGQYQIFGESYAFSDAPVLPVTVMAEEDSKMLLIDSRRITACCSNACDFHNRMIYNLLRLVAQKNLLLHQKIQCTSKRSTRDKLMAYLLHQATLFGSDSFTIPYDRQELADYLEVDRSGLSAEISKMRKEGLLECHKNQFKLLRT